MHGGHVDADALAVNPAEAPFRGGLRNLERVRVLQQRLRGDAAPDEARAAQGLLFFNHRYLEAELGGTNRGNVTAGARTNDDHVVLISQDRAPSRCHPFRTC